MSFKILYQLEKDIAIKSLRRTLLGPVVSIRKVAGPSSKAPETQMTTLVTEGARRERCAGVH